MFLKSTKLLFVSSHVSCLLAWFFQELWTRTLEVEQGDVLRLWRRRQGLCMIGPILMRPHTLTSLQPSVQEGRKDLEGASVGRPPFVFN